MSSFGGWMSRLVGQRLLARLGLLLRRDVALLAHPLEHERAPLGGRGAVLERVVAARRGDEAGDHRGLGRREHLRALRLAVVAAAGMVRAEVHARGGLDPVGAVAEVDRVEVVAEDPLLRPLARDLVGQRGLAHLLEQRAVVLGGERVLDELHRDRRAALHGLLVAHVLPQRAADAAQVDAGVRVEAAVLDRDDRLLHVRGDLVGLDEVALLVAGEHPELVAVAVDDHRVGAALDLELREVGRDRHQHPEDRRDDREDAEAEQDAEARAACGSSRAAGARGRTAG